MRSLAQGTRWAARGGTSVPSAKSSWRWWCPPCSRVPSRCHDAGASGAGTPACGILTHLVTLFQGSGRLPPGDESPLRAPSRASPAEPRTVRKISHRTASHFWQQWRCFESKATAFCPWETGNKDSKSHRNQQSRRRHIHFPATKQEPPGPKNR